MAPRVALMVAEKPSICNAIADALSNRSHETRGRSPPVHEFLGQFRGEEVKFRVTSVVGHIFSTDFPKEYSSWDAVDPATLFQAPVLKVAEKGSIINHLKKEAQGVDYLVLWLDCDREGENICFEVIDVVRSKLNRLPHGRQQIYRAKFSAVTRTDIEQALRTLGEPNLNESLSVDARQELDLKVGVAFSRFQTRYFQGKYGDLDSSLISYGPCQTPTLGFCVDRHDEITSFKPETFWTLDLKIQKDPQTLTLEWERGRVFDQEIASTFEQLVKDAGKGTVRSVKESEGRRTRPQGLNTVEMLKLASKGLGMGPQAAMHCAENLYLQGYISYPRTESTTYPESFDLKGTLMQQRSNPLWGSFVSKILAEGLTPPRKGVDVGDHPPITPVAPNDGLLTGDTLRLYDLITRNFIASVSPDSRYLATTVTFSCGSESFSLSGSRTLDPGFQAVLMTSVAEVSVPSFTIGEEFSTSSIKLRTGQTSPPGYLTESELISLMERHGIGTDASIATHINNICTRNYVALGQGRTLIPTALGILLVHGYHLIDGELVLPRVRGAIEQQCTLIAKGLADKDEVVSQSLDIFHRKFQYFVAKIEKVDSLFEAQFSPLADTGRFISRCGKCTRYMRYIHLKPQRLYCPTCQDTYNLPQNGTIKQYMENKCPLDGFELVLFSLGNSAKAQGKSYPLCPSCYNMPPFQGLSRMGCDSCLHPSCKHSAISNGVCPCPESGGGPEEGEDGGKAGCGGLMVLDVNSKPNWKLSCNSCNLLIRFHGPLHNIKVLKNSQCEECGCTRIKVEFHKEKSPLGGGEVSYEGCVVCDDLLNSLTELKQGRFKHIKLSRRGGRGGRRGRGRGRGRGKSRGDPKMSFSDF